MTKQKLLPMTDGSDVADFRNIGNSAMNMCHFATTSWRGDDGLRDFLCMRAYARFAPSESYFVSASGP
jgi:hypothetical protein